MQAERRSWWGLAPAAIFIVAAGLNAVWCDEAEVHEQVQPHRVRIGWLARRAFAGGRIYARIFDREEASWRRTIRALMYGCVSASFLLLVPVSACAGMRGITHTLCRSARHWGRSVGLLGLLARSINSKPERRVAHAG